MDKIDSNIEGLLIKKSEVEKIIRSLHDQSGTTKRQIQAAFDEARNKLAAK